MKQTASDSNDFIDFCQHRLDNVGIHHNQDPFSMLRDKRFNDYVNRCKKERSAHKVSVDS